MSIFTKIFNVKREQMPLNDQKVNNESWENFYNDIKYSSGTASGSVILKPVHSLESNYDYDLELNVKQQLLEERVKSVEERQKALESTHTEWINDLESKVNFLERESLVKQKERLRKNVDILIEIGQLEDNWNQYGAKKFNQNLIYKCIKIINETDLQYQPEIFPTGRESIQFEYEPDDDHYLEIEIFEDRIKLYIRIDSKIISDNKVELQKVINRVNEFQSKF